MGEIHYRVSIGEEQFITETKAVETLKDTLNRLFPESVIEPWQGNPSLENIRVWQAADLIVHLVYERRLLEEDIDFEMP